MKIKRSILVEAVKRVIKEQNIDPKQFPLKLSQVADNPEDAEQDVTKGLDDGNKTDDDAAVSSGGGTIGVGVTPSLSRAPSREARSVSTWRWRWVSEGFIGGAQAARTQGENAVLGASKFAVVGKNARRTYA